MSVISEMFVRTANPGALSAFRIKSSGATVCLLWHRRDALRDLKIICPVSSVSYSAGMMSDYAKAATHRTWARVTISHGLNYTRLHGEESRIRRDDAAPGLLWHISSGPKRLSLATFRHCQHVFSICNAISHAEYFVLLH